jgi:hypothetical protein
MIDVFFEKKALDGGAWVLKFEHLKGHHTPHLEHTPSPLPSPLDKTKTSHYISYSTNYTINPGGVDK